MKAVTLQPQGDYRFCIADRILLLCASITLMNQILLLLYILPYQTNAESQLTPFPEADIHLVKKYFAFHITQRFITAFTMASNQWISRVIRIQSIHYILFL
jgi:hypothetical protein